jgi:hypothetical protein
MAIRGKLHKSHLEAFKNWLENHSWVIHEPKGDWEVLRAKDTTSNRWLLVHSSNNDEHLSFEDKYDVMVSIFLREYKQREAFKETQEALQPAEEFITHLEFMVRLNQLERDNWKVAAILKHSQHKFESIPEHQQKLILKALGLERIVTVQYKVVAPSLTNTGSAIAQVEASKHDDLPY